MISFQPTEHELWLLNHARKADPEMVELAKHLTLIPRVEPLLLRNVRLDFLPSAQVETETHLWFSSIVSVRSSQDFIFHPGIAGLLAEELQREAPEEFKRLWYYCQDHTCHWEPLQQQERDLHFHAIQRDADAITDTLQKMLSLIHEEDDEDERINLARWAKRNLPLFINTNLAEIKEIHWLAQYAAVALGDIAKWTELSQPEPLPEWLSNKLPRPTSNTRIGLQLYLDAERQQQVLECIEPKEGVQVLLLPSSLPSRLHIKCEQEQGSWEVITIGSRILLPKVCTNIYLTTLNGQHYTLKSEIAPVLTDWLDDGSPPSVLDDSNDNWYESPPLNQNILPALIIGDGDAAIEWVADKLLSERVFLHTVSYEQFKRNNRLYLYGGRGSGKTSIIQMMHREINYNNNRKHYAVLLDQEKLFIGMLECSNVLLNSQENIVRPEGINRYLKSKWRWIINILCMREAFSRFDVLNKSKEDAGQILAYFNSVGLSDLDYSPVDVMLGFITISFNEVNVEKVVNIDGLIDNFNKSTNIISYNNAVDALERILSENSLRLTILIDLFEYIPLNNISAIMLAESLTEVTYDIYAEFMSKGSAGILVKVAFPSEIQSMISSRNAGIIGNKTINIIWGYKDLISLLAKRFYMTARNKKNVDVAYYESLNEYMSAIKYLNTLLPDTVTTSQGFKFATLSYIIRYTHKKPRQIIMLMNAILTYAMKTENYPKIPNQMITEGSIIYGLHSRLDLLFNDALCLYDQLYKINTRALVLKIFNSSRSRITGSELDEKIKAAHSIRSEARMTVDQVKTLMLEAGVIGQEVSETKLPGSEIRPQILVSTNYVYQTKILPTIGPDSMCAIHPLMYQSLNCKLDKSRITYPISQEDDELRAMQKTISSFE